MSDVLHKQGKYHALRAMVLFAVAFVLLACDHEDSKEQAGMDRVVPTADDTLNLIDTYSGPEIGFGNITSIAVSGGLLAVADGMHRKVYLLEWDEPASDILEIGGPGAGPGEFGYPLAVGFRDGEVLVYDERLSRLSRFSPEGRVISTEGVEPQPQFGQESDVSISPVGDLYALGFSEFQQGLLDNLNGRARGVTRGQNHIVKWDPKEENWSDLVSVDGVEVFADVGRGMLVDIAYPRKPLWKPSVDGRGVWFADSGDSAVSLILDNGSGLDKEVPTGFSQFPAPTELRDDYLDAGDLTDRNDNVVRRTRRIRAELPFPSQIPPLLDILPDRDGTLWVVGRTGNGKLIRKIDFGGSILGEFGQPEGFDPLVAQDGLVFGIQTDVQGVQTVGVYSVTATNVN